LELVKRWRYFESVELDQPHLERKLRDLALQLEQEVESARTTVKAAGAAGGRDDVEFLFEVLSQLPALPEVATRAPPNSPDFSWDRAEAELGAFARVTNGIRVPIQQKVRQAWQKSLGPLETRQALMSEAVKRADPARRERVNKDFEQVKTELENTRQAERREIARVDQEFKRYLVRLYYLVEIRRLALEALVGIKTEEGQEVIRYGLQSDDQGYRQLAAEVLQLQNWQPPTLEARLDLLVVLAKLQGTTGGAIKEIASLIRSVSDVSELVNVIEPKLAEEGLTELQALLLEHLSSLHDEKALDRLAAVMASTLDPPALKARIAGTLPDIGTPRAGQLLISAMDELDTDVRTAAAEALGRIRLLEDAALRKSAMERLVFALRDGDIAVRDAAAEALKYYPEATENLAVALTQDRNPNAREYAARALGSFAPAAASTEALLRALQDDDSAVRMAAARALERQGVMTAQVPVDPGLRIKFLCASQAWKELRRIGASAVGSLMLLLRDRNEKIRLEVVQLLGAVRAREAVKGLAVSLSDSNQDVRREAAVALRLINDPAALDALRVALPKEGFKEVRVEIERGIKKLEAHNA
jgi:HEAT repeat protein